MRALVIKSPWIELILDGKKTWEVRSRATAVRERIALIRSKSGQIFGTAELVACHGPFSREQMMVERDKHQVPPERMSEVDYEHFYAWELKNVRRFERPVAYKHPAGAVIWVTLNDGNVAGGVGAISN